MKSNYTVISASAGSGKTYTLVQKLLMICLDSPYQQDVVRHILALTFTNKAANEMKERILQWLDKFVADDYMQCEELLAIEKKFKEKGKSIPLDELHRRSKSTLDYILHHYSTLNIGTIDKFNSKLVRAFSYELGLAQNFNLEIQPEPFLIEAVDQMLNQIGSNKKVSEAFMDFVEYNLDNDERTNLSQILYDSAKKFVNDIHYEKLLENKNFDWEAYETLKNKLRRELKDLQNNSTQIAQDSINLIKNRGLEVDDFAGGSKYSIAKFFHEIIRFFNKERNDFPLPINEVSALENFEKGASSKSKHKENDIFEILHFLIENRRTIINNQITIHKKEKTLHALLPLRVNKDIQDELAKIEDEKDLVLLSKFNVLINENLKSEPSAFIYEKVGTQYAHYFFDEFQDTSALQWQNFLPLRDHTISSSGTSFTLVGDPKQSIYRFRGGDSQLMLDIINGKEETPIPATKEILEANFRSAKNIVDFNNQLYQYISEGLDDELKVIFGEDSTQIAKSNIDGQVRINLIENKTKEEFYDDTVYKMTQDIQKCLNNGFRFSDICILCRGNSDIFNYSQLLSNQQVTYDGQQVFIKTISERGLTLNLSKTLNALIQFLNWTISPKNKKFLVLMMYYLNLSGRIKIEDFSSEMIELLSIENQENILAFIKEKYNLSLDDSHLPKLNLYNFIEFFINEFSVKEKEISFLLNFLEMLYGFTQNTGVTLKDFLTYWEEEGQNISIQASDNVDAIQIMTIHKAKGLEFPIVLLPMENKSQDGKFTEWYDLKEANGLHSINISGFNKDFESYDEDILKFNQENIYKNFVDRLCVQYVATTRPVEQLFLYIQKPSKSANHLEIFDFVNQKNTENMDSFDFFQVNDNQLKKQKKQEKEKPNTMEILPFINKQNALNNITIATPSKNYQNRKEKVRIGILIHDVLAKINHKEDLNKILEAYSLSGKITREEKKIISERIVNLMNNEKYARFFNEKWQEIFNEREIFITNDDGELELYRPDRIIKGDEGYIIIDFKTGEEDKKYEKQIQIYQKTLEKLGKKVAETCIMYF